MPRLTCAFCPFVVDTEEESVIRAYRCHIKAHERYLAQMSLKNFGLFYAGVDHDDDEEDPPTPLPEE